ncbi:uncharacterized protein [Anabrus simplex]|uniref:uncharacterized protein n=1 Tax=Anabrus simplex TaxID=316456 RepID=UPI0035A293EB
MYVTSCVSTASAAATLQFVTSSSDRPLALYRAPAPYQEVGKPLRNSIIITSKPFNIGEHLSTLTTTTTSTTTTTPAPLWRRHMQVSSTTEKPAFEIKIPQYNIDCTNGKSCSETIAVEQPTPKPTFKTYPADVIDKFLRDFATVRTSPKEAYEQDREISSKQASDDDATNRLANLYLDENLESAESEGKSRWSKIPVQAHNHPFDDKEGWVTLDPIPWSSSKVSKWHSNLKTSDRPPSRWDSRPSDWDSDKPVRPYDRPSYDRPTDEEYDRPVKPSYWIRPSNDRWGPPTTQRPPSQWNRPNDYDYDRPHNQPSSSSDIITDGKPGRWPEHQSTHRPSWQTSPSNEHTPHYDYSISPERRPGFGHHHQSRPEESDGEWVLLSSNKGYALPHRHKIYQRALTINPTPITSRRTVRLTVLPALNGTANTTISHGGMLEVESTFQSVDEEQHNQKQQQQQQIRPQILSDPIPQVEPKNVTRPAAYQLITQSRPPVNSRAVLAAVGAGMLPATMAVLMPMFLGRRRRDLSSVSPNITVQPNFIKRRNLSVKRISKKILNTSFKKRSKLP